MALILSRYVYPFNAIPSAADAAYEPLATDRGTADDAGQHRSVIVYRETACAPDEHTFGHTDRQVDTQVEKSTHRPADRLGGRQIGGESGESQQIVRPTHRHMHRCQMGFEVQLGKY
jgi:hypothetical protein